MAPFSEKELEVSSENMVTQVSFLFVPSNQTNYNLGYVAKIWSPISCLISKKKVGKKF
jgi:hypothetical protein